MNKPSHPAPPFEAASPPYELDGYGWAMAQAKQLRERRFDELDIENIAEEIESVGKSEQKAAESNLKIVLIHHLKWMHQPERRSGSWVRSIGEHLRRFDRIMHENPSLKPLLPEMLAEAYQEARFEAGEETGLDEKLFSDVPPGWDDIRAPRAVEKSSMR